MLRTLASASTRRTFSISGGKMEKLSKGDVAIPGTRRTFCTSGGKVEKEKIKVAFEAEKIKVAFDGLVNNFATKQVRTAGLTVTALLSFKELYSMVKEGFVKDAEKAKALQEARFQAIIQLGREAVGEIAGLGREVCSLKEHVVQALKDDKVVLVVHEVRK